MTHRSTDARRILRPGLAPGAVLGAALALAACGGDEGTGGAQVATAIQVTVAPAPGSAVGQPLVTAPAFVVKDQNGSPMGGVPVAVTVVQGGGTLTNAPTRSASGSTVVGNWTLGNTVGVNRLQIAVANVKPETVSVTSVAGVPTSVVAAAGNAQQAGGGAALPAPVVFAVRDQFGNGVAGKQLSLLATGGGSLAGFGPVDPVVVTTGADGSVAAPVWTLSRSAKPQTLTATLVGGALSGAATATVLTDMNIDVRFVGPAPVTAVSQAFLDAAARLRAIVVGDLPNVATGNLNLATFCGDAALPTINETIDDVVIFAQVKPIDGVGQILGQAGPCAVRDAGSGRLPVIGVMTFDEADLATMVANGTITDVITHEMMHVLGFGSGYFGFFGIISGLNTPDVAFTGANGVKGCRDAGGVNTCQFSAPLENTGGAGTANSHWRKTTFGPELMTGFISANAARPLSRMTIGAFQDLGYQVNYSARDDFSLATALVAARPAASLALAGGAAWETVREPAVIVSRDGTHRRVAEAAP